MSTDSEIRISCPACRADNDQGNACRRCRADLSLLWTLERERRGSMDRAQICLRQGLHQQALDHLRRAAELRHGADVDRLAALAHLLRRDFAEALRSYQNHAVAAE